MLPRIYSAFKKVLTGLVIVLAFSSCDSGPQVDWEKFEESALQRALESGRPTLVYFYAAWCRPCQQLRSSTFRDERVISALAKWNRLKADMSFREDKTTLARTNTFNVWALPTLIIYETDGKVRAKISGYVSADKLLEVLKQA